MKKLLIIVLVLITQVLMAFSSDAKFLYTANVDLASTWLWRGLYSGGLSLQPDLGVGIATNDEKISLNFDVWANIGSEDWSFKKNHSPYLGYEYDNTGINPELDLILNVNLYGLNLGAIHYWYCGKYYNNMSFFGDDSQTEVYLGYDFSTLLNFPIFFNYYITLHGADVSIEHAFSSYIEIGYSHEFNNSWSLDATLGITPWKSMYTGYEGKFAVNNLELRLKKSWNIKEVCEMSVWGQGMINSYTMKVTEGSQGAFFALGYSVGF